MTTRKLLLESLENYHSPYPEEQEFKTRFASLLPHPRAFFRDHLPGHITASAWIVDETRAFALLTHHAKLNRWLQPGGHADGDEDAVTVAEKEAIEETGLTSLRLIHPRIFDIDIHRIPARKDFPDHLHYDIRFLFHGDKSESFIISKESRDLAWIPFSGIAAQTENNPSIIRMAEKVRIIGN